MRAADPFRISPGAALARGGRELWRAPAPTLAALLGSMTAALAARAAWVRAGQALAAEQTGRAALIWLVGASVAALLVDVTRAVALSAYAGPSRPLPQLLALGLLRTPGMISVRAVELLVYLALGLGDLLLLARALARVAADPARQALLASLLLLPSLALALVVFAASRVAQTVIARGLSPAAALTHGYDLALRRFPSLARLALSAVMVSAPLVVAAWWMPFPLRAVLLSLAALWLYAALATLVGRDGRLSGG